MHPAIRALGKVLRLVGISSPEDALVKPEEENGPPSWRRPARVVTGETKTPAEPGAGSSEES
jgi:hypothetical protein